MQTLLCDGQDATFCNSYSPLPYHRFRDFLKFRTFSDARVASGMASAPNPLGVLFPLTFTQNENAVDPRGLRAVLFSGTGWVWGTPVGSTPSPRRAVHSYGITALHFAAQYGNRRIVRLLVASDADVNAQNRYNGCAFSASASAECAGRVPAPSAVQVDAAALRRGQWPIGRDRRAALARRRRGRPGQPQRVTPSCAAQLTEPHSRARAGARRSNPRKTGGSSCSTRRRRGRCTQPAASQPASPRPRAHPSPSFLFRRMCRRCSPSALAEPAGREATAHTALHGNGRPRCARALLHPRVEV
jgi:hypothetical protein